MRKLFGYLAVLAGILLILDSFVSPLDVRAMVGPVFTFSGISESGTSAANHKVAGTLVLNYSPGNNQEIQRQVLSTGGNSGGSSGSSSSSSTSTTSTGQQYTPFYSNRKP